MQDDKEGVAAMRRRFNAVKYRAHGRAFFERSVRMPYAAKIVFVAVLRLLDDVDDVGKVVPRGDEGYTVDVAKNASDAEMILGAKVLVTKKNHLVIPKCLADGFGRGIGQGRG